MDALKCKTEKILKLDLDIFTHAPRQNSLPGSYHHPPPLKTFSRSFHMKNYPATFTGKCSS